jgi:hypothetical protein
VLSFAPGVSYRRRGRLSSFPLHSVHLSTHPPPPRSPVQAHVRSRELTPHALCSPPTHIPSLCPSSLSPCTQPQLPSPSHSILAALSTFPCLSSLSPCTPFPPPSLQAAIWRDRQSRRIVVSFRGTSDVTDVLTDVNVLQVRLRGEGWTCECRWAGVNVEREMRVTWRCREWKESL